MSGRVVTVRVVFEAGEEVRRAVAHRVNRHGRLATKDELRSHYEAAGYSTDDDLIDEWQDCDQGCNE